MVLLIEILRPSPNFNLMDQVCLKTMIESSEEIFIRFNRKKPVHVKRTKLNNCFLTHCNVLPSRYATKYMGSNTLCISG